MGSDIRVDEEAVARAEELGKLAQEATEESIIASQEAISRAEGGSKAD